MKKRKRFKYKCWQALFGWRTPQLQIQITPFQWNLGCGIGPAKFSIGIGPVAIALHWGPAPFERECR